MYTHQQKSAEEKWVEWKLVAFCVTTERIIGCSMTINIHDLDVSWQPVLFSATNIANAKWIHASHRPEIIFMNITASRVKRNERRHYVKMWIQPICMICKRHFPLKCAVNDTFHQNVLNSTHISWIDLAYNFWYFQNFITSFS